jgi:hypothetical protein
MRVCESNKLATRGHAPLLAQRGPTPH